ncbi:MAG: hypothetical protein Kow0090_08640 [Myxococcota bacterium]
MSEEKKKKVSDTPDEGDVNLEDKWFNDAPAYKEQNESDTGEKSGAGKEADKPPPLKKPIAATPAATDRKPVVSQTKAPSEPMAKPAPIQSKEEWVRFAEMALKEAEIAPPETAAYLYWQAAEILLEKLNDRERANEAFSKALAKKFLIPVAEAYLNSLKTAEKDEYDAVKEVLGKQGEILSPESMDNDITEFIRKRAILRGLSDIGGKDAEKLVEGLLLAAEKCAGEERTSHFRLAYSIALRNGLSETAFKVAEKWGGIENISADDKAEALILGANHAETVLADSKRAIDLYGCVLRFKGAHPEAVRGLKRLLIKKGDFRDLAETYIVEANASKDKERAAFLYFSAGRILRDETEEKDAGLDMMKRACELDPKNPVYLTDLADAYTESGKFSELAESLERLVAALMSNDHKVETLCRLGELYNSELGDPEKAITAYAKALELNPFHSAAMAALGRLYSRREKWNELAALYEKEIEITSDNGVLAGIYYKLAALTEERLGNQSGAIEKHKKAIELSPNYQPSLQALAAIYLKLGDWKSLCEVYEKQIKSEADVNQKIFLWGQIAEIREARLDDIEGAASARREQLALDDKYLPALRSLAHILFILNRWDELLEVLGREAELADDKAQKAAYLHSIGELYDEKLKDEEKAEAAYKEALSRLPTYMPSLRALGRIFHKRKKWNELIQMNEREIEVTGNKAARRALMMRQAEIYEERLGDLDKALEIYLAIKRENEDYIPIYRKLERIYEIKKDWKARTAILEDEVKITPDKHFQARYLYQIGELKERYLNDVEGAASAYRDSLLVYPGFEASLTAMIHLLESEKRYNELDTFITEQLKSQISTEQKIALYHRQAKLREGPLADPAGAREAFVRLLEIAPDDADAHYGMLRLSLRAGDLMELTNALADTAKAARPEQAMDFYFWAAEIKQFIFKKPLDAAHLYVEILNINPYHIPSLRMLSEIYEQHNVIKGLRMVLERLYKKLDGAQKCVVAAKLGVLLAEKYGETDSAEILLAEAMATEEAYLFASSALARLMLNQGRLEDAAAVYEQRLKKIKRPEVKLAAIKELYSFYKEKLPLSRHPRELLETAAEIDCFDPLVETELSRIYREAEDWRAFANLFKKRSERAEEPPKKAEQLIIVADAYLTGLGDRAKALDALNEAIEISPNEINILKKAAELSLQVGMSGLAVSHYNKILSLAQSKDEKFACLLKLAEIYLATPDKDAEAKKHLEMAYTLNPSDEQTLAYLAEVCEKTGDWNKAKRYHEERLAQSRDEEKKIAIFLTLARISNERMEDPAAAADYLNSALELNRAHPETVKYFARLLTEHENFESLIELYRGTVAFLGVKTPASLPYLLLIGDIYLTHLNNPESALAAYQEALEIEGDNPQALERLANCFSIQQGREKQAISVYHKLIELDPFIPSAYRRFFAMYFQLRELDAAYCIAQILTAFKTGDNEAGFFIGENKPFLRVTAEKGLSKNDVITYLIPPGAGGPVKNLLANLSPDMGKIVVASLDRYKLSKNDKVKPGHPLSSPLEIAAKMLGIQSFEAYTSSAMPFALAVEATEPPTIIAGEALIQNAPASTLMFIAGYLLGHLHEGLLPMIRLGADRLRDVVYAVVQAQIENFEPQGANIGNIETIAAQMRKNISRKVKKNIEGDVANIAQAKNIDFNLMAEGARAAIARSAVIVSNDIGAAISGYLRFKTPQASPPTDSESLIMRIKGDKFIAEMLKFYASQKYFDLRKKLGIGIFRQ